MAELEKTVVDTEYNASEIQVLEGLEAVRKRPGMYIGSTSASGLHHLVYEIVDNAIDEALAGYCTDITVTINDGDTITVTDNGRGIPVDIQAQTGRPALEVVFTVLHAGGKFGGGGYKVSGGLHGVGASVVNALSEWLTVQVHKDGKIYEMKFSRGNITQEMKIIGETDHTGTTVTFKPDPEMFDTLEYDYETLHTRMREQAFLNAGLRITISDARPGREKSEAMCYEGGIREFVTYINRNKTPLHEEVIYLSGAKGDSTAEIAIQYNDGYNETLVSFANDIHTPEGGMHETGFKAALTRVLNAYGLKYGMIKEGDKVSGEDVREGITAVISVKLTEAQFEGQTKAKLGNAHIRTLVDSIVNDQLAVYLEEHPVVARTILDKAMTANRAREAARKARESIRRKTVLGGAAMPDKLRDCNEANPELTELIRAEIGEGFLRDLDRIGYLREHVSDELAMLFNAVKLQKKSQLAAHIRAAEGVDIPEEFVFDVQVKRAHEYKRQLMNALCLADFYFEIKNGGLADMPPTAFIFGAKAAPGYRRAKAVIRYINRLAELVNNDPDVNGKMRIVFVQNYNCSYAEHIIPAADISEQISPAGTEASGTGNMKLMLNGAVTLGTMDGANVEIRDRVGDDNMFLFGMTADEVQALWQRGYDPHQFLTPELDRVLQMLTSGALGQRFDDVAASLLTPRFGAADSYMTVADFESYKAAKKRAVEVYQDRTRFAQMSLTNIARAGIFSSDRSVEQYAKEIWDL